MPTDFRVEQSRETATKDHPAGRAVVGNVAAKRGDAQHDVSECGIGWKLVTTASQEFSQQMYLRVVDKKTDAKSAWARRLKERRHVNVAAVALAAKHARIAWAILAHGTDYRPAGPQPAMA